MRRFQLCAVNYGKRAAILAAAKSQFFSVGKRRDQKHQLLKADARVRYDFLIHLERLTQHFPARNARQCLPGDRCAGPRQCPERAAEARQQRTFLFEFWRAREVRALLWRFAARPRYGKAGFIQITAIELGIVFRLQLV
jgi:hypothetical protein